MATALALALVSWATNITTPSQALGEADGLLAFRSTLSKLANSGTVWAGLMVLSGWLVRRPLPAAAAGVLGGLLSLVAHYVVGRLTGMFDATIWADNSRWFIAAALFGAPLGLVGAAARRRTAVGLAARLVVPLGAVLEPVVFGMFWPSPVRTWPDRTSEMACGAVLLTLGIGCCIAVVLHARGRELSRVDG